LESGWEDRDGGEERGGRRLEPGSRLMFLRFLWDQRAEKKVREPEDKSLFRQAEVLSKK